MAATGTHEASEKPRFLSSRVPHLQAGSTSTSPSTRRATKAVGSPNSASHAGFPAISVHAASNAPTGESSRFMTRCAPGERYCGTFNSAAAATPATRNRWLRSALDSCSTRAKISRIFRLGFTARPARAAPDNQSKHPPESRPLRVAAPEPSGSSLRRTRRLLVAVDRARRPGAQQARPDRRVESAAQTRSSSCRHSPLRSPAWVGLPVRPWPSATGTFPAAQSFDTDLGLRVRRGLHGL